MTLKNSFLSLFFIFILFACQKNELKKIENEKFLFGTSIRIVIYDKDVKKSEKLIEETFALMGNIAEKYNSRNSESVISKLNANPVKEHKIDKEFYMLIKNSLEASELTQGKFDITISPVMKLWGFDDLDIKEVPNENTIKETLKLVSYKDIKLTESGITLKSQGQNIDTGAFLKGFAISEGRKFLQNNGIQNAMITAISSIETIGNKPDGSAFKIGVQNPKNPEELLYGVELENKALGVSGDYQTYVEINGKRYHHIIDATTGYPSENNSMVLVLGDNAFECDLYSTSLFMMKTEEILEIIKNKKNLEVFIVDKNGNEYFSEGIKKYLKKLDKK